MREKKRYEIEVHVAGISFRKVGDKLEVLIAKRSPNRKFYPNKWECGGGQVYPNENFIEAVKRQLKEELNIEIKVIAPLGTYEIAAPDLTQKKVPGIHFACEVINGEAKVDGEEHVECKWVSVDHLDGIDFIPGLDKDILHGSELMRGNKS